MCCVDTPPCINLITFVVKQLVMSFQADIQILSSRIKCVNGDNGLTKIRRADSEAFGPWRRRLSLLSALSNFRFSPDIPLTPSPLLSSLLHTQHPTRLVDRAFSPHIQAGRKGFLGKVPWEAPLLSFTTLTRIVRMAGTKSIHMWHLVRQA